MPNLTTPDWIGHVGYALVFLGTLALAQKLVIGWVLRIIGALIWIILGVFLGMTSIWFWEAAFILVDVYGLCNWKKYV